MGQLQVMDKMAQLRKHSEIERNHLDIFLQDPATSNKDKIAVRIILIKNYLVALIKKPRSWCG